MSNTITLSNTIHTTRKDEAMTKSLYVLFLSITVVLAALVGCSDQSANEPDAANAADVAGGVALSELTLMKAAGIGLDGSKGVFSVAWREMFNPNSPENEITIGRAMAVVFDPTQQTRRGGIDIGTVSLNYGSNHLELQKRVEPNGGVLYTSFAPPRDNTTNTNIEFSSSGSYEFEVTGSTNFSAMSASLTAPATLLDITSPVRGNSISTATDVTMTWIGGLSSSGVVIVVMPRPEFKGGPMGEGGPHREGRAGGHPPMLDSTRAIIVHINNNPGTYTIAASKLQELVTKTSSTGLVFTVSQFASTDISHDGGTVMLVLRNGDRVGVSLE